MKRENNDFSYLAAAHVVSSDDLAAADKALRQEVLRKAHGWWKPAEDRANLIDTLRKLDEGRMKDSDRSATNGCFNLLSPSIVVQPE
jgi:hypothetical protein